jgi:hypothetical protein
MASSKLSALVSLAGGQVPTDLAYVDDVSAGAAGSKSSTLNDLFAIVTKNITDGALRFGAFAAPALSAAAQGALYFDSGVNRFLFSENAGAYVRVGNVTGPGASTDEALARFDLATGRLLQNSNITLSDAGALSFPDDVRQVFNPGATVPGLNVGAQAGDPSTPVNGDLWYDSTGNLLRARINGATVSLTGGDVVGPATATDNAIARFDGTTGKIIQDSAVTVADTTGNFAVPNSWQAVSAGGVSVQLGVLLFSVSTPTTGGSGFTSVQVVTGAQTQAANVPIFVGLAATLNQTGTAGGTSLAIARTETALGSGQHDFIRGFGGAGGVTERFRVSNTGQFFAGSPSTSTGQFVFAVSGSANTQAMQGADVPANTLTFKWPSADPTANQVLTASAPAAGIVTLTWATGGGGGTPGGADTQVQYNNTGAFGGITGLTSNGTNVTAGSGNLRATRPQITTSLDDSNGNEVFVITATASAVNEFTVANAATGGSPTMSTSGGDADIPAIISPKGTARLESTGPLRLSGTGSDTFTTPLGTGVPSKINIPVYDPGNFGQIIAVGIGNINSNRRVISLFDARSTPHQPTLAVFSPDENQLFGFSWEGSNTDITLKTTVTRGVIRMTDGANPAQLVIAVAGVSAAAFLHVRSDLTTSVVTRADAASNPTADVSQFTIGGTTTAGAYAGVSQGLYLFDVGSKRVSTQFDKTNDTTLANITGLSVNVVAGKSYRFEAVLYTTSNVATGVKFAIAGTATATAIIYEAILDDAGDISAQTRATALGTAVAGITAVTNAYCRITGTITVNAAGTLTVQFAENAAVAATTSSVLVGSTFTVNEIV